jgi:hypothetical protein
MCKVLKYPSVHDYRRTVVEYDEKLYVHLQLGFLDLRWCRSGGRE